MTAASVTGRLSGKVAIVTGAARGIGAATARLFAEAGAAVVLADRRDELGAATASAIDAETPGSARYVTLDVTSEDDWADAVAQTVAAFGGVDVLVNNAGIIRVAPLVDCDLETFRKVVDTNLVGAFLGMRAVVEPMRARGGGSIVNFSSPQGHRGPPRHAGVHGVEVRGPRAHQDRGDGARPVRHPRQRGRARPDPHRDDRAQGLDRRRLRRRVRRLPARPDGRRRPRSRRCACSSRPTSRRSAPAPTSWPTAASPRASPGTRRDAADASRVRRSTGRVAIVTGGGRGIGRALSVGLAAAGAAVVATSRSAGACDEVAAEIEKAGGRALAVAADVGDAQDRERIVAETVAAFGRIDVLVNNAGILKPHHTVKVTEDELDEIIRVNLKGPVFLSQLALPYLEADGGGAIVNISALGAFQPMAGIGAYCAVKAAMVNWTSTMAKEWTARGVRVNGLVPGPVATEMILPRDPEKRAGFVEEMGANTLVGRLADPSDLVAAVIFLATDASAFMTGRSLFLDGGMLA